MLRFLGTDNRTVLLAGVWAVLALLSQAVVAGTYASAVTPFNWIDPTSHTRVSATSSPYSFINSSGCGTSLPTIDDNITNVIPIGFNFLFGDKVFDSVRINSNGRLHFVKTTAPTWDNTTCGYGSPVTQIPIPNGGLNYVMRLYGNDLDPTPKRPGYNTKCEDGVTAANNPCFVSFATVGTSPNRKFVVSWKGVPEWVSSGSKGSYDMQIVVQEDGDFIYQYGDYVAGPSATAGQIGYQLSTSNYDVPTSGFPAQDFAIKYFVPHPLVEYLMEQPSWSGSGSVIDSSGSGKNGTPVGGVAPVTGAKVCRGADIPSNANTNNIDAIDSGVNVSTEIGSAGTIAFWYKANSAWSGGGVKDAQLLDATIVENEWFFLVRQSNARLRFVIRDSNGNDQIVETGAISTSANTWRHVAVTWNFNPLITANNNKLTVYVDGTQRAQTTFTSSTTSISSQLGSLYIGDNRSGFIGVSGTGRSADAVLDEVRIYNYALSQQGVASLMNLNSGCLDHYSVTHSGSGSSCQAAPITIASHTSTHADYVNYDTINLSTSDSLGNWSLITGRGVLTPGPANSGTATYRFNAETEVILGLTHPSGTVTAYVKDTNGNRMDQENSPLTITSTGCAPAGFNACHDYATSSCKAGGKLFTKLANANFSTDVVALNASGNVDTGFTGKAVVSLIARATPGSVGSDYCFTPDAGGTQVVDNGVTSFTSGKLSVTGKLAAAWREARVKIVCNSTDCPPSGMTACSQDNFAIRPGAITLSAGSMATPPSSTATPALVAGNGMTLTATSSTAATDGYAGTLALDTTKLTAQTTSQDSSVQGGGTIGTLSPSSVVANVTPPGSNSVYTEVGYLYLAPGAFRDDSFTSVDQGAGDCIPYDALNPTNTGYLSSSFVGGKLGCAIGNESMVTLGRFRPAYFDTEVTAACVSGSFTYSGQVFPLKVTARNAIAGTTSNYAGAFAKAIILSDANGASGAFSPATIAATSFASGVADLTATPGVKFTYTNKQTSAATLKVGVTESSGDGVSSSTGAEGATNLRSGRLRIANAFGSENLALLMPAQIEYFSSGRWVTNANDNCTLLSTLAGPAGALTVGTRTTTPRCLVAGNSCTTTSGQACNSGSQKVSSGDAGLCLTAPGVTGSVSVPFSPVDYLQFNGIANPSGQAGFGLYNQSGNSKRVIDRREVR